MKLNQKSQQKLSIATYVYVKLLICKIPIIVLNDVDSIVYSKGEKYTYIRP